MTKLSSVDSILAKGMDRGNGPVPECVRGTNFYRSSDASPLYARLDQPTLGQLEDVITALDGGDWSLGFNTGMAAITAFFMALPKPMTLVIHQHLYYGVWDWLDHYAAAVGIKIEKIDLAQTKSLEIFLKAQPKGQPIWIWVETLLNPTWEVMQVDKLIDVAQRYGAKVAVDNTAATPVLCRPLLLGADIVAYSASKYLNGHHDLLAGFVVGKTNALKDKIWLNRRLFGSILQSSIAWDCWRGLRTLAVRMRHVSVSADLVATFLSNHPKVSKVFYPGFEQKNPNFLSEGLGGGTLSFCPKAGVEAAQKIVHNTHLFRPATSYGGFCSLIEHRAGLKDEKNWIPPDLIRLSVGLEGVDDLIADLNQALESI